MNASFDFVTQQRVALIRSATANGFHGTRPCYL